MAKSNRTPLLTHEFNGCPLLPLGVLIAVISSYLGFGLTVVVTEQILSSVTTKGAENSTVYFAADVITQCL